MMPHNNFFLSPKLVI